MLVIWRPSTIPETWTVAEVTNYVDPSAHGLKPNLCIPIPSHLPPLTLNIETEGEPSDFIESSGGMFVVSEKLRRLLDKFHILAEYIKLEATHLGNKYDKTTYYFANMLDAVDCFDYRNSQYIYTPTGIEQIETLILDEATSVGHHLFLVGPIPSANPPNPKAIRQIIYGASEELAREIIKSGITGVVFTAPTNWRDYPPPAWRPDSR